MKKLLCLLAMTIALAAPTVAQMPPPPPPSGQMPPPPPPPPPPRSITVSGEAHEEIMPDQAILSMSLVSRDKSLHTAKQNNDKLVEKLVAVTKELEIPKDKIATTSVNISPEYNYINADRQREFVDYMVSRSFRVTIDKLDNSEKLLSAAVEAGVEDINGIEYTIAKPEEHEAVLRVKAFADAKAKAQALAQAADSKLGPALDISIGERGFMPPRPMMLKAAKLQEAAPMSVAPSLPGIVELRETLSVTFALE